MVFDSVQSGWLAGDDYRRAAEAAGVVELPDPTEPAESVESAESSGEPMADMPDDLFDGRWEDADPPGCPR